MGLHTESLADCIDPSPLDRPGLGGRHWACLWFQTALANQTDHKGICVLSQGTSQGTVFSGLAVKIQSRSEMQKCFDSLVLLFNFYNIIFTLKSNLLTFFVVTDPVIRTDKHKLRRAVNSVNTPLQAHLLFSSPHRTLVIIPAMPAIAQPYIHKGS